MKKKVTPRADRRFVDHQSLRMEMPPEGEGTSGRVIAHHSPPWDVLSRRLWYEYIGEYPNVRKIPVHEVFRRGAFTAVLAASEIDVLCLRDHNNSLLLGRFCRQGGEVRCENLRIMEDHQGLRYECQLPPTALAEETAALVESGILRGSSFAFDCDPERGGEDRWAWANAEGDVVSAMEDAQILLREVLSVSGLYDTGPVSRPAYPEGSGVGLREAGFCEPAVASLRRWAGKRGVELRSDPGPVAVESPEAPNVADAARQRSAFLLSRGFRPNLQ